MNWSELNDKKTPFAYRVIRRLVWLFSPKMRVSGAENLPDGACVIVGNHSHMYGPIAGELYTPGRHSVWCAAEMMHREDVAEYAFQDFWSGKPRALHWYYRLLSHLIAPLSVLIFGSAHTIPVFHDARLVRTFRATNAELAQGSRIVIFPECYRKHNNIVYGFQDKFVDTARFYYKKSGQALAFVPMYLAPRLKTMTFGEPVVFRPEAPIAEERARICGELAERITALAASMPRHTVIPYPNVPKREYPQSLPIEVYADETTDR